MDGNLTALAWQLLSSETNLTIAQVFLTAILAIFTTVLAIFTRRLSHATDRYAVLVGDQNDMMKDNRDHELLVKKYTRMLDEMNNLVAPLYANRNDPSIFISYSEENLLIQITLRENTHNTFQMEFSETYRFWKNIYEYLYLSQSYDLTKCLKTYMKCIENYGRFISAENHEARKLLQKNSTDTRLYKSENVIYNMKNTIEDRYDELDKQIKDIQDELRISESSRQASNPKHEDE